MSALDASPDRSTNYLPEVQALRALAVALVIGFHFWPSAVPGGFVGVDVFFVISGYLIIGGMVRESDRTGRVALASFWSRRMRRLLPLALVVLAATAIATLPLLPQNQWILVLKQIAASGLYVQNWVLANDSVDYLAADNIATPVQHFWSLSVEEQFYIAVPILIVATLALVGRRARFRRSAIVAMLGTCRGWGCRPRPAAGDLERRLAAELHDDALGPLVGDDVGDVLEGERLEVEAVGDVVVGADRLRVAVDHDRLVALLARGERGVHAAVVELDALADAVGAGAQDDDALLLAGLGLVLLLVGGVEVRGLGLELRRAGVDGLVDRQHVVLDAQGADLALAAAGELAETLVAEAVALHAPQELRREALRLADLLLELDDVGQLAEEERRDAGELVHLVHAQLVAERLQHELVALGRGDGQRLAQVLRLRRQVGRRVELARAHGLLERLLEGASDGHGLPHALHVRGELAVGHRELLERPARHLDHHVVERGLEAGRRLARDVVVDLVQGVADGQAGGDLGDREAGGLGGERRAARDARVHLDDHDLAGLGVDGELDVAAPGVDADLADDRHGGVAQLLVLGVGEGQRRRDGDAVAGVDSHGVDVLDGADDDHVVRVVAHDLELELVPADDGLLEQDLRDRAEREPLLADADEALGVVGDAAAGAAERVRRADDERQAELLAGGLGLLHGLGEQAARRAQADLVHGRAELEAVLGAVDGLLVGADHLDAPRGRARRRS